ncbi:MAG: DUF2752 domain-containing protein [Lachnospiraceae bacterium]|nr:DUF2752 domain-containing protein [Lachnospiraceae bacterium]
MTDRKILFRDFLIVNISGVLGAGIVFVGMLLARYDIIPNPDCTFHAITHLYCPGCGGTRATFALLSGRIIDSIKFNPAVVFGALLILHYEIGIVLTLIKNNGRRYYTRKLWPVYLYVAIVVSFFIIRNLLLVFCGIDMLA